MEITYSIYSMDADLNKTTQRKARLAHRGTGEEEEIAKKKTRMENKRVVVVDVFREGKADQQLRVTTREITRK